MLIVESQTNTAKQIYIFPYELQTVLVKINFILIFYSSFFWMHASSFFSFRFFDLERQQR